MVETDPRVVELIHEVDAILIPGPRKRVTDEVNAWAARNERNLPPERLLVAYNEAVEESVAAAVAALRQSIAGAGGKQRLFSLLNEPRATDLHRRIALDALAGSLERDDLAEFGRVNARQRSGVVPNVRRALEEVDLPQARFILHRLIPGADEVSAPPTSGRPLSLATPADEGARDDLLFDALVLPAPEMAALADGEEAVRSALAQAADERDEALIAAGRTATGLSDYESVLRRELHLLVALAALDVAEDTRARARDSVFALDLSRFEREIAPNLPGAELVGYVSRALSPENRRNRPDRAEAALRAVERIPAAEREPVRGDVLAALGDRGDDVRFAAVAALASCFEPTGEERSALVETVAGLPDRLRAQLQPLLGSIGSEVRSMSFRQVIDWAAGAPAGEAERRVGLLLEEWQRRAAEVDAADAGAAIAALSRKLHPLPPPIREQLVATTIAWLRKRRGTAAANRALIEGWPRFAEFAVREFAAYATGLSVEAAQRLLWIALHPGGEPRAELLAAAAAIEPGDGRENTVSMPVFRKTLDRGPELLAEAVAVADDPALVNLLAAAITVTGELGRALDDLEAVGGAETTEALHRARERVLEALEVAERDSVKNEELRAQLGLVRDALHFDSGAGGIGGPGEVVMKWRAAAADRYPGVAVEPVGGLRVDGARAGELADLMLELDPRANGRGVVPAADRPHFGQDLARAVGAFAALGEPVPPELSRRASPKLREELERMALAAPEAAAARLSECLASEDEAQGARAIATVARVVGEGSVRESLERLPGSRLRAVAPMVERALVGEHARLERARQAKGSREDRAAGDIARRLAVPFQAIETRLFSYFRLRAVLEEVGWQRVAASLGSELQREDVDPATFTVTDDRSGLDAEDGGFLVRSLGIRVGDQVVDPAIVEPIAPKRGDGSSEEKYER
jgi:hypothetical protein